jgi:ferredoxin--NADP+ reductase
MPEYKAGTVFDWHPLSPVLSTFSLRPADGGGFPDYKPGQYIALRRDDCHLTKRVVDPDGTAHFVPILDEAGRPRRGPVTHSYSIASPPYETREKGYLNFYVVLEQDEHRELGRLTESFFRLNPPEDDKVLYVNRIVGDFTLDKRAKGFRSVLLVGTGTGLAPFISMVRQLDHDAEGRRTDGVRYTLIHANRTTEELGYHRILQDIEAAKRFDFLYLPSVSRPKGGDFADPTLGRGRANNLLRHIIGLPLREEQDLGEAEAEGRDSAPARAALEKVVRPALPGRVSLPVLRQRLDPADTVVLTCGNPSLMADIKLVAEGAGLRFEKEDW